MTRHRFNKFRAKPVEYDGIRFASTGEGRRYLQLKLLLQQGYIEDLKLQVDFPITINGQKVCSYRADFVYTENNLQIVEDFKGVETPVFKLKRKLMRAVHNIEIRLTH